MEPAEIRRENLRKALKDRFDGVPADLARSIERDDAYVWQLLNGVRNIGEKVARHIERTLKMLPGDLDHVAGMLSEPAPEPYRKIPVVGTAQLGEDGFHLEMGFPVGHGDGFVSYASRDPNAYALRVKGDSMRPRIKPGEFVLVEPNQPPQAGEEVLVRTKDGRVMVKVLDFHRDGIVQLSSINEQHRPITLEETDIELLHFVAAIVKAIRYYRTLS